jgi:hypothetical protein
MTTHVLAHGALALARAFTLVGVVIDGVVLAGRPPDTVPIAPSSSRPFRCR